MMKSLRAMLARFAGLFRRKQNETEMNDELRAHLDALTERNLAAGMSPDEARNAALRVFGGVAQIAERARDERRSAWGEHLLQDLRYAVRQLRKTPGFTAVVVVSLALGIGANAFFFGLLDRALVRSLPVRNPGELVRFQFMTDPKFGNTRDGWYDTNWSVDPANGKLIGSIFSLATFEAFRAHQELFTEVFAFAPTSGLVLKLDDRMETALGQFVSGEYYHGLGLGALHGRVLLPDDDRAGAPPVAVISRAFWQRAFAGDPAVLGKTFSINHTPVTIVGVVSGDGADPIEAGYRARDVTLPLATLRQIELRFGARLSASTAWWLSVMARLRPGVTAEQAATSLDATFQRTARDGLNRPTDPLNLRTVAGGRGLTEFRRQSAATLWLPAAFAGIVLLAACTNVATLLLARGSGRRREIAVRLALGASRERIVGQLVIESVLLSLLGAAAGLLIAAWGGLAWAHHAAWHLDWRVLGFTTVVAFGTAIGFGLVPALRATQIDLVAEFQGGGRARTRGGRTWLSRSLVVFQIALSCVLLVFAGLLVRTVGHLRAVDLGFDRSRLLLVSVDATYAGFKSPQGAALFTRISERIAELPGVRAATFSTAGQLSGYGVRGFLRRNEVPSGLDNLVRATEVAPDYFATYGIPIVAGRSFTAQDIAGGQRVVIINERAANLYFGEQNPVGRPTGLQDRPVIVGVVRDAKRGDLRTNPPAVYLPFAQIPQTDATLTIRTGAEPTAVIDSVRKTIAGINADLVVGDVWTMNAQVEALLGRERLFAQLAGGFGLLALTLACVGLYGFLSYAVIRRTWEIGVRVALGAGQRDVVRMILAQSLGLALAGIGVGLLATLAAVRLVTSITFL